MAARQFFFESNRTTPADTQQVELEKKITRPATTLTYTVSKVPENSVLKFRDIYITRVVAQYPQERAIRQDIIGTFTYKPMSKKE